MKPLTEEQMKRVYELLDTIVRPETHEGNVVDAVEEAQVLVPSARSNTARANQILWTLTHEPRPIQIHTAEHGGG
jgi:hypothetical protein